MFDCIFTFRDILDIVLVSFEAGTENTETFTKHKQNIKKKKWRVQFVSTVNLQYRHQL